MKFKLDENLDARFASILVDIGHECDSVRSEGLGGQSDEELFRVCAAEGRVLVTRKGSIQRVAHRLARGTDRHELSVIGGGMLSAHIL